MAIGNVVERGNYVCIYDEKGNQISSISVGSGPNDGLKGYTSTTVNVQRGNLVLTHDEKGQVIRSTSVW